MAPTRAKNGKTRHPEPVPSISSTDCPVCGAVAWAKHFNVITCNACSAFFRRSVALNKQYFCKRGKNCMEQKDSKMNLCKFCRFQKCVKIGMSMSSISKSNPESLSAAKSPLKDVIICRKATFVNRIRATIEVYGGQQNMRQMANMQVDADSTAMALRAEFRVVSEYLHACGLIKQGISASCLQALAKDCLYTWMIYEGALNTVRNAGHQIKRVFFIDESYLPVNEDKVLEFYKTDQRVGDAETVARHGMEYYSDGLRIATKLYQARLDDAEQAALAQLLVLQTIVVSEGSVNHTAVSNALSSLFENLKQHYVQNYDDVALRMGNLVFILQEILHLRRIFDEHVIVLTLNGKRTVISELDGGGQQTVATKIA